MRLPALILRHGGVDDVAKYYAQIMTGDFVWVNLALFDGSQARAGEDGLSYWFIAFSPSSYSITFANLSGLTNLTVARLWEPSSLVLASDIEPNGTFVSDSIASLGSSTSPANLCLAALLMH